MTAIDLRSDTVTKPSAAMRRAMAEADVGDDVYGEDPTVNALQERAAALLGTEAALFVPTGCMASQVALQVLTRPGDEVLAGRGAHNYLLETGAASALSGVQVTQIGEDGRFTGDDLRAAYNPDDHHHAPTRVVSVENTHNMGGGLLWDRDELAGVLAASRDLGLSAHLDGARLWNAAVASGTPENELAAGFDTVAVCLSKGLGAPVGSLLCGSAELMRGAHRARKRLGGGMRQAGILAAAGLYALEHNRARLADDHGNARQLGNDLDGIDGLSVDVASIHTNIVMANVAPGRGSAQALVDRAGERGVLFYAVGAQRVRFVTHLDLDRSACARAAGILAEVI
jgi:threonine aldolase